MIVKTAQVWRQHYIMYVLGHTLIVFCGVTVVCLTTLCGLAWIRSYWQLDEVQYSVLVLRPKPQQSLRQYFIGSYSGTVYCHWSFTDHSDSAPFDQIVAPLDRIATWRMNHGRPLDTSYDNLPSPKPNWWYLGFGYDTGGMKSEHYSFCQVVVPYWFITCVCSSTALYPIMIRRKRIRAARRETAGLCPACGYDLRASPTVCPECGRLRNQGRAVKGRKLA